MQRIYRGIAYTASSQSIATVETETFAQFRGSTYRVCRPIDPPTPTRHNLVYRGVAYDCPSEMGSGMLPVFG